MKQLCLAAARVAAVVAAASACGIVHAEEAKPDNEVSFNIGAASEYRYRGISQSRLDPALQGGADYTHNPSGFYAGTWLSSIKWTKDAGGDGNVEWDIYGGKKGEIVKDVSYDVGVLSYVYPSNGLNKVPGFADANTTEIYGQIGYGPAYVKYSHSVTNLFGYVDSKNSGYLDIGASFDIAEGYALGLHVGHQKIKNNSAADYTDWKVGVTKEFFGVSFNLAAIGTNANDKLYVTPDGKFTGKTRLVLVATKTF
jgi:uncharacterized protein (TIGR02001 family)